MSIIKDILMQHDIKEDQALKFDQYYKMICEWNEKINLTAITDESEAAYKHFIDCLACFKCGKISPGAKIIDVGTGAGFPGRFFHRKLLGPSCTFRRYPTPCPVP